MGRMSHTCRRTRMKVIDKEKLITNMKSMINALEYDSMRSAGKAKINAQTLYYLYELLNKYNTNSKMATPKKETK
jgi:ribosomal protein L2